MPLYSKSVMLHRQTCTLYWKIRKVPVYLKLCTVTKTKVYCYIDKSVLSCRQKCTVMPIKCTAKSTKLHCCVNINWEKYRYIEKVYGYVNKSILLYRKKVYHYVDKGTNVSTIIEKKNVILRKVYRCRQKCTAISTKVYGYVNKIIPLCWQKCTTISTKVYRYIDKSVLLYWQKSTVMLTRVYC